MRRMRGSSPILRVACPVQVVLDDDHAVAAVFERLGEELADGVSQKPM
jgi:hypothetical protein